MTAAYWARIKPDAVAVRDRFGARTFAEVNGGANAIVRLLRAHGVGPREHIAFISSNRAEMMQVMAASHRGGYRLAPVNWHLTVEEMGYILADGDIAAVFVETRFPAGLEAARATPGLKVRIAVGGEADGFLSFDREVAARDASDIADPVLGSVMLYTSGTTGRPKGVYREHLTMMAPGGLLKYAPETDAQLCAGPLYHGSALTVETRTAMTVGVPVVYMDRWDSIEWLTKVQTHRITHTHMVPVMFQRLLAVPEEVRRSYDISSLKELFHGAAPCPPEVKRAMIDWVGPILHEYYSGTEGGAGFMLDSHEWLRKPGSVGRRPAAPAVKVLNDDGAECAPGVPGRLYFERPPANGFTYYKDPEKTAASHIGNFFTLGDIGYFDEDDYLFLTGRSADCIISGGVNIYPQEIDNEILKHPGVEDVATVGAPNQEWGEEVRAVVVLRAGWEASDALAAEITAQVRGALAGYKVPRGVDFVTALPRNAAGKIERGKVRAPYWAGRARQI